MAIVALTESDFYEFIGQGRALALFRADWSEPSRLQRTILEEISDDFRNYRLGELDADEQQTVVQELAITVIPSLCAFERGRRLWTRSGLVPEATLRGLLSASS